MAKKKTAKATVKKTKIDTKHPLNNAQWILREPMTAVTSSLAAASRDIGSGYNCYFLAEGDSWFDYGYLGGYDIISWTMKKLNYYGIDNNARVGDTLEHMIAGINGQQSSLDMIILPKLKLADKQFPNANKILLFSGGGNDMAGDSLIHYLNPASSGLPPLRVDYLNQMVNVVFRKYYEDLITKVSQYKNTYIITHGYAYAMPTGIGHQTIPGINFAGPWLLPAFQKCGITDKAVQQGTLNTIIDAFNDVLESLADKSQGRFIYIDLRKMISSNDWQNEMHLTSEAYGRVADRFVGEVNRLVGAGSAARALAAAQAKPRIRGGSKQIATGAKKRK